MISLSISTDHERIIGHIFFRAQIFPRKYEPHHVYNSFSLESSNKTAICFLKNYLMSVMSLVFGRSHLVQKAD